MEGFRNQERNLDKDRKAFMEAINMVSVEEIPTVFDEEASSKLVRVLIEQNCSFWAKCTE